jgi:hypothetical protein
MRDEFKRKTMSNNSGEFSGTYRNADLYGAGHSKRINEQKRKEKRRARRSMKQQLKRMSVCDW